MNKKTDRLIKKFGIVFLNFTVITLIISFLMTYVSQIETYKKQCRDNSRNLGTYLSGLMEAEGEATIAYKEYYMEHFREISIPMDFTEYLPAQREFVKLFTERYPEQTFGIDIKLAELDEDVQQAYFRYKHEYWILTFEHARDAFRQAYTYFLVLQDPRARTETITGGSDGEYSVVYLIDGERTEDTSANVPGTLYLGDTYLHTQEKNGIEWDTWETGRALDAYYEWNNAWGHTYTYYTPLIINGEKVGLVCTEVEVETVNAAILQNSLIQMAGIAVILIVSMIVMLWVINRSYISKVRLLEAGVREYSDSKNTQVADRIEASADSDDELGSLSKQTASMMRELDRYITDITDMTAEKERLAAELSIAAKIQRDMMPKDFPKRNDLKMYALMSPAKDVGGDFYDYFFIDSNHLGLVMADISGNGVPAALFMVIAKTLIANRAMMGGSPSRVLEDVNFSLCENNPSGMFITTWLGILTLSTGKLVCANAGHEYPAIRHKNGKYELMISEHCPPLASMDDLEYNDDTFILEPGDSLFLYTDGIPEAKNSLGKHLGTTKMLEILNAAPDLAPYELLTGLKDLIDDFARGTDTFDDITMMCINYLGKQ